MDPPFPPGSRSWDALSDSVWQGLYDRSENEFAIIWPNAHKMALRDPLEFRIAIDALEGVYELLLDSAATLGRVKHVSIVLEGQWSLVRSN
jgi:hypothetical protein